VVEWFLKSDLLSSLERRARIGGGPKKCPQAQRKEEAYSQVVKEKYGKLFVLQKENFEPVEESKQEGERSI